MKKRKKKPSDPAIDFHQREATKVLTREIKLQREIINRLQRKSSSKLEASRKHLEQLVAQRSRVYKAFAWVKENKGQPIPPEIAKDLPLQFLATRK